MERLIDIQELMGRLSRGNITPEEMIGCAIRNLYSLEASSVLEHRVALRNSVRSVIAYAKMLYDYGQQMCLARIYLLHRIRLLEVRENDFLSEISVLRGISPYSKDDLSIVEEKRKQPLERNRLQVQDEDDSRSS